MPVVLLAYEWLFHTPPPRSWKALVKWLRGPGSVLCCSARMNLVFIYGKRFGPDGLLNGPSAAYKPVLALERIVDFQERYIGDIFYHLPSFDWLATLLIWLAVTYLVWRRNRALLRFCWFYVLLTPLPISFLEGRKRACVYICLAGWAVLAATLFTDWLASATRVQYRTWANRLLKCWPSFGPSTRACGRAPPWCSWTTRGGAALICHSSPNCGSGTARRRSSSTR